MRMRMRKRHVKTRFPFNNHEIKLGKLIPSIVTLIGLIVGVGAMRYGLMGKFEMASYSILLAAIIDGVDGRVARMLGSVSTFGAELDSLCDLVNFGVSPAIVLYLYYYDLSFVFLWPALTIFIVCMCIRLARFNSMNIDKLELNHDNANNNKKIQNFFLGVPAPVGAMLLIMPIIYDLGIGQNIKFVINLYNFNINISDLFHLTEQYNHYIYNILVLIYVLFISLLLPSRIKTISMKNIPVKPTNIPITMVIATFLITVSFVYSFQILFLLGLFYILSIRFVHKKFT